MSGTNSSALQRFEGSYLGDASRLPADAVLECKICWHVYDPAQGCETWQVPPGTAFKDLPDHWRCPVCDGARDQFMVVSAGRAPADPLALETDAEAIDPIMALLRDWPARMEALFREIHAGQMRGLPFLNDALGIKAVGFRAHEGQMLGVLITPWFMNLVLAPGPHEDWSVLTSGGKELIAFPSGVYEFTFVNRQGPSGKGSSGNGQTGNSKAGLELTPYKACSLFSPMSDFTTMPQAIETAEAVLTALFDASLCPPRKEASEPEPVAKEEKEPFRPDRRSLLFGPRAGDHGDETR
ncbi:[NiFe]-hydrogenase assembly chaperone HybE [Beijerinckia indica]|uniref:Rubredoxin-type Fe(Cys)4 protein n=1 Tax=Beijerinckia indica subsp. indica (strain ATCC 9039 / DSM 1715 / NCIMB 8712) TaxID=395963 RepID=B2IJ36_BEII9|nr:[NiFe]-hydrogenase assembly chaperone HybE [Beijerinckia indica]ACB94799.1 Rubredoxin-type Fe(Cys)4 protein [Beijerinckia indica subsp. indica ATCC 9039]